VTGTVLRADGTPADEAVVLVYRAHPDTVGGQEDEIEWLKTRLSCDGDGRFRIGMEGFDLVRLVAKGDETATEPVLARPGDDVVLRLP
jgi:hypothetical protein